MNETATRQLMANTCPQTKEQKMQRQKARSEIANAKPKGKRQVKASQGNTSYGKMVKQDKPFVKKQNTHGRKVNPLSARQVFACRAFSFCGTYLVERRIAWQMCLTLR